MTTDRFRVLKGILKDIADYGEEYFEKHEKEILDLFTKLDKEAYERGLETAAMVAEHQATICGSSLSRQSTSIDISKNIRRLKDTK